MTQRLGLITWDDDSPTGGNAYNTALVAELRIEGVDARILLVGSGWPDGTAGDRAQLGAALADWPVVLVDGIVAGTAPDEIGTAVRAGTRVGVLVHLPLADEVGLAADRAREYLDRERAALAVAHVVLVPSRHTAAALAERYGRTDAVVAPPGVTQLPVAKPQGMPVGAVPHLLCIGAITPTKNQLAVIAALEELGDLSWTASLVGSTSVDPGYADLVQRAVDRLGGQIRMPGALTGSALDAVWARTDLLVSASRVETYGLVVAEALARGIPAVVPAGTGAVEALGQVDGQPPGLAVDPSELSTVLRDWVTTPDLRLRWRDLALRRRRSLPTWPDTAAVVRAALLDRH